jgi:hypothetical protein
MTAKREREIGVEFEMLKQVRRRAKTVLADRDKCGLHSDFEITEDGATLFETKKEEILRFATDRCHWRILENGSLYICVVSLFEQMKTEHHRLLA